ncbi:MAG: hypothetical protein SOX56_07510, partial [[Pasteurella] mairii]|nr:hypothetical protein [[Pasteurella] mairii]
HLNTYRHFFFRRIKPVQHSLILATNRPLRLNIIKIITVITGLNWRIIRSLTILFKTTRLYRIRIVLSSCQITDAFNSFVPA